MDSSSERDWSRQALETTPSKGTRPAMAGVIDRDWRMKMRGLNVRVEYAKATIAKIVDPNTDALCFALHEAEAEGYRDYHARLYSVPVMFADVPGLVTAWQSGQNFATDCEELENCPLCEAAHGDPCPVHG